jgi:hypothetical protein
MINFAFLFGSFDGKCTLRTEKSMAKLESAR